MLPNQVQRRISFLRLLRCQEGATAIEYAVLLSTVTVSLSVGVFCLGKMSQASLTTTSEVMRMPNAADPFSESVHDSVDSEAASDGAVRGEDGSRGIPPWQIVATGVALFVAGGAPLTFLVLKPANAKTVTEKPAKEPAEVAAPPSHDENAFTKRNQIRRVFENNMASLLDGRLKVRHIMSRQLTCVRRTTTVDAVRELMESKQVRHIMVTDDDNRLLGMISEHDIEKQGRRAQDIMTAEPFSLDIDADLSPAVTTLIRRRISCLPITHGSELSGVVTTTDLLMALQCALHTLSNIVEHLPVAETTSA